MIGSPRKRRRIQARYRDVLAGLAACAVLGTLFYISYNANSGLPWESRYSVSVEVPTAARTVETDQVRVGGNLVGRVVDVTAIPAGDGGSAHARIDLDLEPSVAPLPVDTVVRIRPSSVLGASYVDLALGRSNRTVSDGGRLGLERAERSVELTDLFDIFERSTARGIQDSLQELGDGFAGRGSELNLAFGEMAGLLDPLTRVSRTLASPRTGTRRFLRAYDSFFSRLSPARSELAGLVSNGADTFGTMARERTSLAATLDRLPPAEVAATDALTRLQPTLDGLADVADDLHPAAELLPATLQDINSTVAAGPPAFRRLPRFADQLEALLVTVRQVTERPSTGGALRKLSDLLIPLGTTLEVVAPAQVHCNFLGLYGGFAGTLADLGVASGPSFAFTSIVDAGAQGESFQRSKPASDAAINYLPNENADECESGNERHDGVSQALGNPPGLQGKRQPPTSPPPGVLERARQAGLVEVPEEGR